MVARVLDDNLRPAPTGVAGELFLGGASVARGYLGQPELTAQRFIADPYASDPNARLYRTGDRVRRHSDGTCEFLGRTDEQVKIRGYRVEPGEVAAALRRHPTVRDAAVLVDRDGAGESRLIGFVVPHDLQDGSRTTLAGGLREYLTSQLPAALVPGSLLVLDALPLTGNGKLDRAALLAVPALDAPAPEPSRPPSTDRERQIAEIWSEVLHLDQVGADDNFFALGGHSLLATQVVARLRQRLGLEVAVSALFEFPTITRLAGALEAAQPATLPLLGPAPASGPVPLSYGQRRLWFLDQAAPGESTYNLPYALRLRGRLDADLLERSLERVVASHDALRSTFDSADGEPCVVVHPAGPVPLERVDLSTLSDPEAVVRERVDAEFGRPFDLARGPLYRWSLLRVGTGDHILLLSFHHIVFDGWSFAVLLDELADCYAAYGSDQVPELPRRALDYRDFAHWQAGWGPALAAQQEYWTRQLAGTPTALELPTDRPRPPRMTHRGDVVWLALPAALTDQLKRLAADRGATVFMVLLAAYQALLARHTTQQDLVVGTPVAGRRDAQTERMIGFFVNMLALRTDLSGDPSFSELIRQVRSTTLAAYEHQDLPFDRLVEELRPERDLSRSPIFQTIFTLHNQSAPRTPLPGLTWTTEPGAVGVAKYDLSLVLTERDGGLAGALEYNTDLFDRATAERLADRFRRLLAAAVTEPDLAYTRLAITGPDEQAELDRWNDTVVARPEPALITELFARTVSDRPGAVALTGEDATLTYAELDRQANQLARQLIGLGVRSEQLVGLQVDRSAAMVVGLLGILKAGAAYVPLDPGYPRERLDYMLADAGAAALVTTSSLAGSTAFDGPVVRLDADRLVLARHPETAPAGSLDPDQLAYVLYTSGSTGRPKGVEVTHRAVVNALLSPGQPTLSVDDVVLAVVSLCFDGSVTELLRPLAAGARLVVAPRAVVTDGVRLVELLRTSGATAMMVPTPFGRILVEAGWSGDGRLKLSLGGEALTPDLAAALLPKTGELWNEYGPTETTVLSTSALITDPTRVTYRPTHRQHPDRHPGCRSAARAGRRARRDLHRRPRPGPRLSRPARADGRAVHPRPVARSPRRTALPQRRPRAMAHRRHAGTPRPVGPPGQTARLPDRDRRDRGRSGVPSGGPPGRGGAASRRRRRQPARGLRRRGGPRAAIERG